MSASGDARGAASEARFTSILWARAGEAAPGSWELRETAIDDISSRIRDGRTDAAEAEPDVRDRVRERDGGEDASDRAEERRREERSRPSDERSGGEVAPTEDSATPSSEDQVLQFTDGHDAHARQTEQDAGDGSDVVGGASHRTTTTSQPLTTGI
ncbi:MAG: hypothetical protein VX460_09020, partial [Planctomycetota bacterium]|nr:hypothetical protein [Planctomycetota bacterium]